MKARGLLAMLLAVAGAAAAQDRPFDLQASYASWSMSPFRPLVERECERLIRNGFDDMIAGSLAAILLTPIQSSVDLSSSGHQMAVALWYRIEKSRFSVGVEGEYFDLRVPFNVAARTTVNVLGIPLASVDGTGRGTARLRGVSASFLGRWTAISAGPVELALRAGLLVMPFSGEIALDAAADVSTPLGDIRVSQSLTRTIAQIRDLGFDAPSLLLAPVVGVDVRCRLTPALGVFLSAAAAQGSVLSGGLVFSF